MHGKMSRSGSSATYFPPLTQSRAGNSSSIPAWKGCQSWGAGGGGGARNASPVNGPELLELASHDVMDVVQAALLPEAVEVEPAGSPVTRQLVKGSRSWRDGGSMQWGNGPLSLVASPGSGKGTSPQGAWLGRSSGEHGSGRQEREARVASLLFPLGRRSR